MKHQPGQIFSNILLLLSAMTLLASCASTESSSLQFSLNQTQAGRVWPDLPEVPRYRYAGQLTGEDNFVSDEGEVSGFTSAMRWLAGLGSDNEEKNILQRPQGIAIDNEGRIFVSDVSRQAVFDFDVVNGELHIWEWAQPGVHFIAPIGVALGENGELLVADAELGYVVRLDQEGKPLGIIGEGILTRPTGVARDAEDGIIYVADTRADDIKIFTDKGRLIKKLGRPGTAAGEFNAPTHLAFAGGKLYVADTLNSRIQVFDDTGKVLKLFGERGLYVGNMNRPKGVAVDDEGNIYIVESYQDHLLIFNADGEFLLPIGGTGNGVGRFYLPAGIGIDRSNRIYVADMFNGRVVVFQYLGERE